MIDSMIMRPCHFISAVQTRMAQNCKTSMLVDVKLPLRTHRLKDRPLPQREKSNVVLLIHLGFYEGADTALHFTSGYRGAYFTAPNSSHIERNDSTACS